MTALLLFLLAFGALWAGSRSSSPSKKTSGIKLLSINYRADEPLPDNAPLSPTKIEVDTSRKRSTDTELLQEMLSPHHFALPRSETLGVGKAVTDMATDWFVWGRLGSAQADTRVTLAEALPTDAVRTYASYSSDGASVVIANKSARRVPINVRIRLPRGVYKIERMTFVPAVEGPVMASLRAKEDAPAVFRGTSEVRLERLQGRDFAQAGAIAKPGMLEPGAVCILRYTEQVREVARVYREARLSLNRLEKTNASAARRIRRMLNEGGLHAPSLYAGGRNSAGRRLNRIHRMLLVTGQAQSRQKNDLARKAVPAESGKHLMAALDSLADSLSDTSAILLGLVPRLAIEKRPLATTSAALQDEPEGSIPVPTPASSLVVTVTLINAGAHNVKLVKLGMDTTQLPPGVTCDPHEPTLFGTLRPGQTVQAIFRLRGQAGAPFPVNCCVGDVSYFVPDAPAHLRFRSL